jgi:hypothetical protein
MSSGRVQRPTWVWYSSRSCASTSAPPPGAADRACASDGSPVAPQMRGCRRLAVSSDSADSAHVSVFRAQGFWTFEVCLCAGARSACHRHP